MGSHFAIQAITLLGLLIHFLNAICAALLLRAAAAILKNFKLRQQN